MSPEAENAVLRAQVAAQHRLIEEMGREGLRLRERCDRIAAEVLVMAEAAGIEIDAENLKELRHG